MQRPPNYFRAIFEFCNDWRDTFFYSLLVSGMVLNVVLKLNIQMGWFSIIGTIREITRAICWSFGMPKNMGYAATGIFMGECIYLVRRFYFTLALETSHAFHTFNAAMIIFHFGIAYFALRMSGGLEHTIKVYMYKLFDYPRKIKPPREPRREKQKTRGFVSQIDFG